ncbi:MAG: transglutaminase domain-containing protein [Oscillospiraceae bacterium]|nr:transglutaminase domain-containing protein [Oscillospiraceae bacterium]
MVTKKISDVVLVYDRYYSKKPKAAELTAQRVLLCCGIAVCATMFLLSEYQFPVNYLLAAAFCVAFSAVFSLIFIFVRKRFAIPAILGFAAVLIFLNREEFYERFSYFTDALWLLIDGRFIGSRFLVEHDTAFLVAENSEFCGGVMLGITLLIMLFSMLTAACMFTQPRIIPSFIVWIVLWSPVLISEKFSFSWWLIPAVALYMGAFAMTLTHRDGLALKTGVGASYRVAAAKTERDYLKALGRNSYGKRTKMSSVYYSKYFSVALYAAAVFALLGVVSSIVFSNSKGIDYTKIYVFLTSIGEKSKSPFDSGPVSEYFAKPTTGITKPTSGLGITSPGRGNQEILRVTNPGSAPVYLRGDIGIDFKGNSWTSPVNSEPKEWKKNGLADYYRPVELRILQGLQDTHYEDERKVVSSAYVTVDYLCESSVAFLPAYTEDFGYYDSDMFNIYGDFVARVDKSYGRMNVLHCTALIPGYTGREDDSPEVLRDLQNAVKITEDWDVAEAADVFFGVSGAYDSYEKYVYDTYLGVPNDMKKMLERYLETDGLGESARSALESGDIESKYQAARLIANYLYENYTYSLDTENDPNDVIDSFLNRTKSGHCALYATSMTLLLRELGIPARYCTGFVAPNNGGVPTVLRSKNLHAWCEVYLSGLGWVTFDPTSSSQNLGDGEGPDNSSNSSSTSSHPRSDSSESSESSSRPDHSSGDMSGDSDQHGADVPEDGQRVNVLPYILIILVIILIFSLAVAVMQRYKKFLASVQKSLKRYYKVNDAAAILDKIIAVLKVCGLSPGRGELPDKFYERAEKTFGCGISEYKDLLEAAAFGEDISDELDCARLAGLLVALFNSAEKKLKFPKKTRLRLAILSKK